MRPLGCLVGPSRNTAVSLRRPLAANRSLSALCLGSPAGGCSAIARDKVRTAPSGFDRPALSTRASRYDRGQNLPLCVVDRRPLPELTATRPNPSATPLSRAFFIGQVENRPGGFPTSSTAGFGREQRNSYVHTLSPVL